MCAPEGYPIGVAGAKVGMWLGAKGFWGPLPVRWNSLRGKYR